MNKIVCPCCGCEYTAQEIFLPNYLLGRAHNIVRDDNGKIEMYEGIEQDLEEEFTCDRCNNTFKVKASLSFETEELPTKSMSNEYVSTIFEDRISLSE